MIIIKSKPKSKNKWHPMSDIMLPRDLILKYSSISFKSFERIKNTKNMKKKTIYNPYRAFAIHENLYSNSFHKERPPRDFAGSFSLSEYPFVRFYYDCNNDDLQPSITKVEIFYYGSCIDYFFMIAVPIFSLCFSLCLPFLGFLKILIVPTVLTIILISLLNIFKNKEPS